MRIITGKTMKCNTCDSTFEYIDDEMVYVPGTLYKMLICPKCGQRTIMVPEYNEPLKERIILEEEHGKEEKTE
jgi:NAD-dependent SIR2 family protein deacetylase